MRSLILLLLSFPIRAATITVPSQTVTVPATCPVIKVNVPKGGGTTSFLPQCTVTVKIPQQVITLPSNITLTCTGTGVTTLPTDPTQNATQVSTLQCTAEVKP